MKMIDYNGVKHNDRAYDRTQTDVIGDTGNTPGLVKPWLGSDGYPEAVKTGKSLAGLYQNAQEVNHLFLADTYQETGYFEYNSTENFAHLNPDGNFTVYNQIGTIEWGNESLGHGQFMPYNTLTPGLFSSRYTNMTDETDQPLSDNNPRKGEALYAIPYSKTKGENEDNNANYHFGMEMEAAFTQTESGKDAWGHDIIFEFAGDDDMWLYVDGILVLDLGGIHKAQTGKVNFKTGQISSSRGNTTLRAAFEESYRTQKGQNTTGSALSDQEVQNWLDSIFKKGTSTFLDYSTHSMKMIYMERGAGASNLHMRFNLAAVRPGTVVLSKTISGTEKSDYNLAEFPYQIYYSTKADREKSWHLLEEKKGKGEDADYNVTYKGRTVPVKYLASYSPAGANTLYKHVFFLKPGQSAEIRLPDDTVRYYIQECGVNPAIYDSVTANNEQLAGTATQDSDRKDFAVRPETLADRQQVSYDNHVSQNAMRTLTIRKRLYGEDGETLIHDDKAEFTFRLWLAGENDSLDLANMQAYHVKDPSGSYCIWDPAPQSFSSLKKSEWDTLSDGEKTLATFHTSINGSISKIPADYSVEVRNLIVGSKFRLEERETEIPAGYSLRKEDGYSRIGGSYITEQGETANAGTIRDNSDPAIEVRNQRGWGLTLKKEWSDAAFMDQHDPVYFGVYIRRGVDQMTLVEGSLRQLKSGEESLYWYFDHLEEGVSFDQYEVAELLVDNPRTDESGKVTGYDKISPLEEGSRITLGGNLKGKSHSEDGFNYTVTYKKGDPEGSAASVKNVRTDTVTNFREGIRLMKKDGEGNPLAGAEFILKDSKGNFPGNNRFVSDEKGWITLACLEKDETYTLKETKTPKGYQSLLEKDQVEICMKEDGTVLVNGSDKSAKGYTLVQASGTDSAELTLINVPFTLSARKIDGETRKPMTDVAFRLSPQVFDLKGDPVKDYLPVLGYDKLLTDKEGIIPRIDESLEPASYYLSETHPPAGYEAMSDDLCFSITPTGKVELHSVDLLTWLDKEENDGKIQYTLVVSNIKKRTVRIIKKGHDTGKELSGARFSMYDESKIENDKPKANEKPDLTGTTQEDGSLELGQLKPGIYYLFEEKAPENYIPLDDPVILSYQVGRFTASYQGSPLEVDEVHAGFRQITVWNSSGYQLPKSGGAGTGFYTMCGLALLLGAALLAGIRAARS